MRRLKLKCRPIEVHPYGMWLQFVRGSEWARCKAHFDFLNPEDGEYAATWFEAGCTYIYISDQCLRSPNIIPVLAHEAFHAVSHIGDSVGLPNSEAGGGEGRAYLISWLMKEAMRFYRIPARRGRRRVTSNKGGKRGA